MWISKLDSVTEYLTEKKSSGKNITSNIYVNK